MILRILIATSLFFYVFPSVCRAQVVINEVMPAPGSGNDWIELKNISDLNVNLTGWTIEDSNSLLDLTPSLSGQILTASNYIVVEASNRLNNSGDQVKLRNAFGEFIDLFSYSQSVTDTSWSRTPDGTGELQLTAPSRGATNSSVLQSTPTPNPSASPTPTVSTIPSPTPMVSPNPLPSSAPDFSQLPAHITISEIMACPNTGASEWVELQNGDSSAYALKNWQMKDSQNNSRYFSTQIPAQGFVVINIVPAMLNNTGGDQLSIVRPDGIATSWASYIICTKGKSLVFDGEKWLSAEPSPGLENVELETRIQSSESSLDGKASLDEELMPTASNPNHFEKKSSPAPLRVVKRSANASISATATQTLLNVQYTPISSSAAFRAHEDFPSFATEATEANESQVPQTLLVGVVLILVSSSALLLYSTWVFLRFYAKRHEIESFVFE